jgi:hypothetical protein
MLEKGVASMPYRLFNKTVVPPIPFQPASAQAIAKQLGLCSYCKTDNCPGSDPRQSCNMVGLCFICQRNGHGFFGCPDRFHVGLSSPLAHHIRFGVHHGYFAKWTLKLVGLPSTYLDGSGNSAEHIGFGRPPASGANLTPLSARPNAFLPLATSPVQSFYSFGKVSHLTRLTY